MKYIASALGISALAIVLLVSCNKINLPTEMGQDLIPPVDNIHTFDTTLEVETYNKIFTFADDSARSIYADLQYLGVMNDPIFGKTDAQMFFQLAPQNGKLTFSSTPGKRYIDSVVLSVRYVETYGDTALPQTINVSELSLSNNFRASGLNRDSAYSVRENNFITTNSLGSKQIVPYSLSDSMLDIRVKDTLKIANQLRIKLNNSFGQRLLDYDTSGVNDAYSTDSIFLTKFAGFALKSSGGGNGIIGLALSDTNTRLTVYYRYENATTSGDIDTAVANFYLAGKVATANYIGRDYAGTQIAITANDNNADQVVYIQNAPGLYANIKIPGLAGMQNSVVHLAELQMEQIYSPQDTLFNTVPLFMDMFDNTTNQYKTIPYSIDNGYLTPVDNAGTFFTIATAGYQLFGYRNYFKQDPTGNKVKQWKFNLTRYAQHLVKGAVTASGDLRLYATNEMLITNGNPNVTTTGRIIVQTTPAPARGRVRLGGGNHPTQKMKLRIVYSKLK